MTAQGVPSRVIPLRQPQSERDDEFEAAYQRLMSSENARERKKAELDILLLLSRREWPRGDEWRIRLMQTIGVIGPDLCQDGNRSTNRGTREPDAEELLPPSASRDDAIHRAHERLKASGKWTDAGAKVELARTRIPDPHNRRVRLPLTVDSIRNAIKRDKERLAADPRWALSKDLLAIFGGDFEKANLNWRYLLTLPEAEVVARLRYAVEHRVPVDCDPPPPGG
jgi:hypothetical protein